MKTNRREFLQATALVSPAAVNSPCSVSSESRAHGISTDEHLDATGITRKHMIVRDTPGSSFFEGMLLGNGDVGACVVVRPGALGIHIGKNDCWDIRVSEDIANHVLPFREVLLSQERRDCAHWWQTGHRSPRWCVRRWLRLSISLHWKRKYPGVRLQSHAPDLRARPRPRGQTSQRPLDRPGHRLRVFR
jgi:hypothetical protein